MHVRPHDMIDVRVDDDYRVHFKVDGETVFTAGHGSPESFKLHKLAAALKSEPPAAQVCGACGEPWRDGLSCGQKDNGWPFATCYVISID